MKWLVRWHHDAADCYPVTAIFVGGYAVFQAITLNCWLIDGWLRPTVLAGVFGLIFGIGMHYKMPGARWWGIPWIL
jgi:hypothetical protein